MENYRLVYLLEVTLDKARRSRRNYTWSWNGIIVVYGIETNSHSCSRVHYSINIPFDKLVTIFLCSEYISVTSAPECRSHQLDEYRRLNNSRRDLARIINLCELLLKFVIKYIKHIFSFNHSLHDANHSAEPIRYNSYL